MNNQGRNEQVYNISENNNQHEAIRYISDEVEHPMHSSLTSSLVNTRSVNEIFSISHSRVYDDVSLSEVYGMRRFDVPYVIAAQSHIRCFTSLTNNNASMNLNFPLGRIEQAYSITNSHPRMNDDISLSEVYGMTRIDVPYVPAIQTDMRSFTSLTNNSAGINLNLSLGLSSGTPTRVGRNEQVYNTCENNNQNEAIRYISDGVEETMHTSLTSSLVNPRSVNEIFSITNSHPRMNDDSSLSEVYGMRRIDVPYMPAAQTHMRSFPSPTNNNASINLNLSLGLSSSSPTRVESHSGRTSSTITQRELGESSSSYFPYAPSARSSIFEYGESSSSYSPYAPSARSSILESQHSLGSTSTTIEIGGNDEQQPHIRFRDDPELMREVIREMILRIEEIRSYISNERGLTEDEIMKNISCGNFEVADEGTSENKELCCICQEAFVNGEEIGKLDCAHIFHMNCIKEWLLEKNICPLCKRRGLFVGDDAIDLC